jgi:hypothetical protein
MAVKPIARMHNGITSFRVAFGDFVPLVRNTIAEAENDARIINEMIEEYVQARLREEKRNWDREEGIKQAMIESWKDFDKYPQMGG